MNYIDLILAIPLLWAVYRGFTKGFVLQLATLAALLLGIFGGIRFSGYTADILVSRFDMDPGKTDILAFAITFIVIVVVVHLVARLLDKLIGAIALGFVNRIFGVLFALLKIAFILSILLVIVNSIDSRVHFLPQEEVNNSLLYKPIAGFAPMIFPYLKFGKEVPENNKLQDPSVIVYFPDNGFEYTINPAETPNYINMQKVDRNYYL